VKERKEEVEKRPNNGEYHRPVHAWLSAAEISTNAPIPRRLSLPPSRLWHVRVMFRQRVEGRDGRELCNACGLALLILFPCSFPVTFFFLPCYCRIRAKVELWGW